MLARLLEIHPGTTFRNLVPFFLLNDAASIDSKLHARLELFHTIKKCLGAVISLIQVKEIKQGFPARIECMAGFHQRFDL